MRHAILKIRAISSTAVLRDLARQQNKQKSHAHDFVQSNQFIFEVQTIIIADCTSVVTSVYGVT